MTAMVMKWPLEPEAEVWSKAQVENLPTAVEVATISMAVSLKRIADALNEPNEYGEIGSAAIAGAISRGLRK